MQYTIHKRTIVYVQDDVEAGRPTCPSEVLLNPLMAGNLSIEGSETCINSDFTRKIAVDA